MGISSVVDKHRTKFWEGNVWCRSHTTLAMGIEEPLDIPFLIQWHWWGNILLSIGKSNMSGKNVYSICPRIIVMMMMMMINLEHLIICFYVLEHLIICFYVLSQNVLWWSKCCEQKCNKHFSLKDGGCIIFLCCCAHGALVWNGGSTRWACPDHLITTWSHCRPHNHAVELLRSTADSVSLREKRGCVECWDCASLFLQDSLALFPQGVIFFPGSKR